MVLIFIFILMASFIGLRTSGRMFSYFFFYFGVIFFLIWLQYAIFGFVFAFSSKGDSSDFWFSLLMLGIGFILYNLPKDRNDEFRERSRAGRK